MKNIFNYNHANLKVDCRYLWLPFFAIKVFWSVKSVGVVGHTRRYEYY